MEPITEKSALDTQIELVSILKRASLEWRGKYYASCVRLDSIWNEAVNSCIALLAPVVGHSCVYSNGPCHDCDAARKFKSLLKYDLPPYNKMKDRIQVKFGELEYLAGSMREVDRQMYLSGLADARIVIEDVLDDRF